MDDRAVLFDLDGTLLDTLGDLAASMNDVLSARGFPTHAVSAYKYFIGDGMENLVRRALPEAARDAEAVAEAYSAMRAEYGARWAETTRPYEGVPELLSALSARGVPLAILSNKPDDFTKISVAAYFSGVPFLAVEGLVTGGPRKPDPAGALAIAARLGVAPARFLYLGDTATDMKTAVAAGMHPVGALWGFRTAGELIDAGARNLIARPGELLQLL